MAICSLFELTCVELAYYFKIHVQLLKVHETYVMS